MYGCPSLRRCRKRGKRLDAETCAQCALRYETARECRDRRGGLRQNFSATCCLAEDRWLDILRPCRAAKQSRISITLGRVPGRNRLHRVSQKIRNREGSRSTAGAGSRRRGGGRRRHRHVSSLLDFGVKTDPHDPQNDYFPTFRRAGWALSHTAQLTKAVHKFPICEQSAAIRSADSTAYCGSPLALNSQTSNHDLCDMTSVEKPEQRASESEKTKLRILVGDDSS